VVQVESAEREREKHERENRWASLHPYTVELVGTLVALAGSNPEHQHVLEEEYALNAICGTEGVKITGGWGKWKIVGRPQRVGITVLEGYDPMTVTIPLIIDKAGASVESEIAILEWLGGRGRLFKHRPGYAGQGDTPLIELYSTNGSEQQTALVPRILQDEGKSEIRFVVSNIEYDICGREYIQAIRNKQFERIRQAATVTLLQYEGAMGNSLDSPANRKNVNRQLKNDFVWVTTRKGMDSFKTIAKAYNKHQHANIAKAAREIQKANPKLGASVDKKFRIGIRVKVPLTASDLKA
jgi:hypothetical protein